MAGTFVRVVQRTGWDVEFVGEGRTLNFPGREEALEAAKAAGVDWIEVGEVVPATPNAPQHHRWTTLRRTADGGYEPSGLRWGGPA